MYFLHAEPMGSAAPKVPYESSFQLAKGPVGSILAMFCIAQAHPAPQFRLEQQLHFCLFQRFVPMVSEN